MRKSIYTPALAVIAAALALCFVIPQSSAAKSQRKRHLLFFGLSAGFRHASVPTAEQVTKKIGEQSGIFDTTVSQDVSVFTPENLKHYDAIMFYTTGELPMTDAEKTAFVNFVRSGHGFVGVHSATDTFFTWQPYLEMVGAYFNDHPWHTKVTVDVEDPNSPIVGFLGKSFQVYDEIYQMADFQYATSDVLLKLDPSSVSMHRPNVHYRFYGWPLAWTRRDGKGRVFYCALGHEDSTWNSDWFQKVMLNGIEWSMGMIH